MKWFVCQSTSYCAADANILFLSSFVSILVGFICTLPFNAYYICSWVSTNPWLIVLIWLSNYFWMISSMSLFLLAFNSDQNYIFFGFRYSSLFLLRSWIKTELRCSFINSVIFDFLLSLLRYLKAWFCISITKSLVVFL